MVLVELGGTFPSVFGGFEVEMRISGIQSSTSHSSIQQRPEVVAQRCSVLDLPVPVSPPPPLSIHCFSLSVEEGRESTSRQQSSISIGGSVPGLKGDAGSLDFNIK